MVAPAPASRTITHIYTHRSIEQTESIRSGFIEASECACLNTNTDTDKYTHKHTDKHTITHTRTQKNTRTQDADIFVVTQPWHTSRSNICLIRPTGEIVTSLNLVYNVTIQSHGVRQYP